MTSFAMIGAAGRMGRTIIGLSQNDFKDRIELVGAVESANSPFLGKDSGEVAGIGNIGVAITNDVSTAIANANAVIDFSSAPSVLETAKVCAKLGKALVVGTTGIEEGIKREIASFSDKVAIMISPNMSIGVNLLFTLLEQAAKSLPQGFDIEITETHHRHKVDAPSGTAVRMKEILLSTLHKEEDDVIYGRMGITGARGNEIAIHALRGGDIVGDHTVSFIADGERIELTHRASSRTTFARGALEAAIFLSKQKPGMYSMRDVLG